jgi:hypothetical protein
MSCVTFHTRSGDSADLKGVQRHMAAYHCNQITLGALDLNLDDGWRNDPHWLTPMINPMHYSAKGVGSEQARLIRQAIIVGGDEFYLAMPNGAKVRPFSLALNTAYRMGGDAIKLLVRMHGQCELFCWVDGPNRAWLAAIIDRGLTDNILMHDVNWEGVAALLRTDDTSACVMSYSVCESFPDPLTGKLGGYVGVDDEDGDEDLEYWYSLPYEDCWDYAMAGLRAQPRGLELRPNNWIDFVFSNGVSAWDIYAARQD